MIAGMLAVSAGVSLQISRWPLNFSQAVIGCLMARALTQPVVAEFQDHWALYFGVATAIVLASTLLAYVIGKLGLLDGSTAIWGLLPGASPAMILMAEAAGADVELVSFIQYLRVVFLAVAAAIVARFGFDGAAAAPPSTSYFPPFVWMHLLTTMLIIAGSFIGSFATRIPANVMFAALLFGGALQLSGYGTLDLPPWLLATGYALLGWNIGLKFNQNSLLAAVSVLPQIVISILLLMLFGAAVAMCLIHLLEIDPLTALLATAPGGSDSMAIVAASTKADTSFVVSLQTFRFLLVVMAGPMISRLVAGRFNRAKPT